MMLVCRCMKPKKDHFRFCSSNLAGSSVPPQESSICHARRSGVTLCDADILLLIVLSPCLALCWPFTSILARHPPTSLLLWHFKNKRRLQIIRTSRLAFYGGAIFAPIVMPWFRVLERIQYTSRVLTTATRVAADQFVAAPCLVAIFFSSMSVLEGKPEEITKRLKEVGHASLPAVPAMLPLSTIQDG